MSESSSLPRRELLSLVGVASTVGVSGLTGVSAQQAAPDLVGGGCSRDLRSIACGRTKQGCIELAEGHYIPDNGGLVFYSEPVTFPGEEGCEVTITLQTDSNHTSLALFAPDGTSVATSNGGSGRSRPSNTTRTSNGTSVATSNGGSGTAEQIIHTLSQTGTYEIRPRTPTSSDEFPVSYDLTLECDCGQPPVCCCLDDVTISEGELAELCFYLRDVTVDFGACEVHIPVPDELVEIVDIRVNDALSGQTEIRDQGSEAIISVTDLDNQFTGDQSDIWIACCELSCRGEGETTVRPQIQTLANQAGESIRFSVDPARITVEQCVGDPDGVCGCLDDVTIREGEGGELCFYLRDVDVGLDSCEASIYVPDKVTITDLEVNDAFSSASSELRDQGSEAYINVQDGNDRFTGDQGEIRVACCQLECVEHGQGEATVEIRELSDDEGRYIPSSTNPATVTCRPPETPEYEGCFCIDPIELPVGTTGEACIYLENLRNGFSGCEAVITVPEDICGINDVVFNDAFGLTSVDISQSGGQARIRVNDTANRVTGELDRVRLCCLVIEARAEGTGTISAEIPQIDDDQGNSIPITVDPGPITCLPPVTCPVVDSRPAATDPDNDGRCEDINGNSRMDFDDVSEFFAHMDDQAIQTNVDAFDFNANSRIDFDDIVELFKEI